MTLGLGVNRAQLGYFGLLTILTKMQQSYMQFRMFSVQGLSSTQSLSRLQILFYRDEVALVIVRLLVNKLLTPSYSHIVDRNPGPYIVLGLCCQRG